MYSIYFLKEVLSGGEELSASNESLSEATKVSMD